MSAHSSFPCNNRSFEIRHVDKAAQSVVDFIASDPESSSLLQAAATQSNPLMIRFQTDLNESEFARYCYANNTIDLSTKLEDRSIEQIVPYLLFELNNARQSSRFREIDETCGKIGLEETVSQIEQCEYASAIETNRLLQKWIKEGKMPKASPFSRILPNFRDHYLYQQISGHSQQIADRYKGQFSTSYQGTWKFVPSKDEIPLLKHLFELKMLHATGEADERKLALTQIEKLVEGAKSFVSKRPDSLEARHFLENVLYAL